MAPSVSVGGAQRGRPKQTVLDSRISAEREGSVALSASGAEREVSWRSARDERLLEIPRDF